MNTTTKTEAGISIFELYDLLLSIKLITEDFVKQERRRRDAGGAGSRMPFELYTYQPGHGVNVLIRSKRTEFDNFSEIVIEVGYRRTATARRLAEPRIVKAGPSWRSELIAAIGAAQAYANAKGAEFRAAELRRTEEQKAMNDFQDTVRRLHRETNNGINVVFASAIHSDGKPVGVNISLNVIGTDPVEVAARIQKILELAGMVTGK